jgi:hypothetical protein
LLARSIAFDDSSGVTTEDKFFDNARRVCVALAAAVLAIGGLDLANVGLPESATDSVTIAIPGQAFAKAAVKTPAMTPPQPTRAIDASVVVPIPSTDSARIVVAIPDVVAEHAPAIETVSATATAPDDAAIADLARRPHFPPWADARRVG